jgi:hypothetical protein
MLLNRITRSPGTAVPASIAAEYEALTAAVNSEGYIAFAKLHGFTGAPPSPGSAAQWGVDDWLSYGRRNAMNDVRSVAHGTKITHDTIKAIAVSVSSSPGDVRAGMNCASDFRKLFNRELAFDWVNFSGFAELVLNQGLCIDGAVPTPAVLARTVLGTGTDAVLSLGFTNPMREIVNDNVVFNANKVYSAMTYLAKAAEPAMSYPELIMRLSTEHGVPISRDHAGALSKIIGHAFRTKTPLELPMGFGVVVNLMLNEAVDHKERVAFEKDLKRASREREDPAAAPAQSDTAAAVTKLAEKTREQVVELITRFGHDITQINERFAKVRAAATTLDFGALTEVAVTQAKRVDELEVRCKVLEATVDNYFGSLQEIAKLVDVDPKSAELSTQIKERVGAYREAADGADKAHDRLVAFATKVHDKLSTKDFLALATAVTELLPESEKLALTGGEED